MGDIDFLIIYVTENSRFWKEKSVEDMVTLGPMAQATFVYVLNCSYVHNLIR